MYVKSPDIVTEIKTRKLDGLGHVIRMEDAGTPKSIFNTKPEGRCRVRRPKWRWLDDVEADIKTLSTKTWTLRKE
jgi:hypothetical protein